MSGNDVYLHTVAVKQRSLALNFPTPITLRAVLGPSDGRYSTDGLPLKAQRTATPLMREFGQPSFQSI